MPIKDKHSTNCENMQWNWSVCGQIKATRNLIAILWNGFIKHQKKNTTETYQFDQSPPCPCGDFLCTDKKWELEERITYIIQKQWSASKKGRESWYSYSRCYVRIKGNMTEFLCTILKLSKCWFLLYVGLVISK